MRPRYSLLIGACILALGGCDTMREKYTGERYGDPVLGPRRSPPLNPKMSAQPVDKITPTAPVLSQNRSVTSSPYDQYDTKGNEVGRKNYLKEWTAGDNAATATAPAASPIVAPAPASQRKSFKGISTASSAPAPLSEPAPANAPAPVIIEPAAPANEENGVIVPLLEPRAQRAPDGKMATVKDLAATTPAATPAAMQEVAAPIEPKAEPLAVQRAEVMPLSEELTKLEPAAGGEAKEYPHLADVPKAPEEFKAMRAEKNAKKKELEDTFKNEMEEKQKLDAEPTELPASDLPQVEGMIRDMNEAIHSDAPIAGASNQYGIFEASPSAGF